MSLKSEMILLITGALQKWMAKAREVDKSNTGSSFAEWFFWDELERLAGNKAETLRDKMIADGILKQPKSIDDPGTHELGESKKFISTVAVTNPVERFDEQTLAAIMLKNHKVAKSATIASCALAKVKGNPRRTIKIIER